MASVVVIYLGGVCSLRCIGWEWDGLNAQYSLRFLTGIRQRCGMLCKPLKEKSAMETGQTAG